jgi:50S ribosomal subunit-associated GTPase HflX
VLNKIDRLEEEVRRSIIANSKASVDAVVPVSSLRSWGLPDLLHRMSEKLGLKEFGKAYRPLLFNKKQVVLVRKMMFALENDLWIPEIFHWIDAYLEKTE